ncbi:MAG TPA: dienelactone hydrolase family protein [Candidatus Angelobacter sp.]|jgi:dienelactone hydrolase|nr:dienelactone hydrolase family protein [Candidatus Angelobacter sp.]
MQYQTLRAPQQQFALYAESYPQKRAVEIPIDRATLAGDLVVPDSAVGAVLFAHGSGSSRHSPRNRYVAQVLQEAGLATLLLDLLTPEEEHFDNRTAALRFNIRLLAERLVVATQWLVAQPQTSQLPVGYFGASTGGAAALVSATVVPELVSSVVSRGGRPDLAGTALRHVVAPTLLIVGGEDTIVLELNRKALELLPGEKRLEVVPGATHLFEEPGALEAVAELARDWLVRHLAAAGSRTRAA